MEKILKIIHIKELSSTGTIYCKTENDRPIYYNDGGVVKFINQINKQLKRARKIEKKYKRLKKKYENTENLRCLIDSAIEDTPTRNPVWFKKCSCGYYALIGDLCPHCNKKVRL
ncbi:hypothetical protein LCGC14_0903790 [marine sediment metagenome]|uniref:Uncharacterized protein n=1 Tax=marine sediment metagenome TaxID=412755 RepID=A0A0F9P0D1_9ZZZZ